MSKVKKICMVTVQHSALDDRIYFKQGLALKAAGHEVSIVHASIDGMLRDMSGQAVVEGLDENGILNLVVLEPKRLAGKLMKKFFRGAFYRNFIKKATETGAEIFVAHEAQSILIARKCAERVGGTYVFDSHESLHLDSPKANYAIRKEMPRMPYLTAANTLTQKAIAAFNPGIQSEVIYNASPIPSTEVKDLKDCIIVHEGSLPFNRGLELMMEAMVMLKRQVPDFKFRIVGEVKGEEKEYFDKMRDSHELQDNIEVTGWIAYERLGEKLEDASLGLILNTPTDNNLFAGPANKLFNYMACNICVIAVDLPETTRILSETGAGLTLDSRSPTSLAKTLERLILDRITLKQKRIAAHNAHLIRSWAKEAEKLIAFYEKIK